MTERQVMLVGGGMTKFAADRADASVRDLVVEAVLAAVADAGVDSPQRSRDGALPDAALCTWPT